MKKIVLASLILSAGLLAASCSKDLLDQTNPNALVAENSWNTQADVEAGLVGV